MEYLPPSYDLHESVLDIRAQQIMLSLQRAGAIEGTCFDQRNKIIPSNENHEENESNEDFVETDV